VDDILCISFKQDEFMQKFEKLFTLKDGYGPPKTFLGTEIQRFELTDHKGRKYHSFGLGCNKYLRKIIEDLETRVQNTLKIKLPSGATAPMRQGYLLHINKSEKIIKCWNTRSEKKKGC
jgi:hypothetical protein